MEKQERRIKKLFIIAIVLLIISFLSTIALNVLIYYNGKDIDKQNNKLNDEYLEYTIKNNNTDIEVINYEKDIDFLTNIETTTQETKNEYYHNIKLLEDKIIAGKSNKKIAYITFDDGPYYLTYEYLKVLNRYNVKATFFTIGYGKERCFDNQYVNCYPVLTEIAKNGHTIANHTYSHAIWYGLYYSSDSFIENIIEQENLIKKYAGVTTNITRFPGGSATAGYLKNGIIDKLRARKYGWVDWTASDGDGGELASREQGWNNFVSTIDNNIEVILLHDYNNISLSLLPDFIEYLTNNNYLILPLSYESNMINK